MLRQLGYLLPTREAIMEGRPETAPLLKLAEQAASLGFASLWVGNSLTARPRHEPLTLLAAVSGRTSGLTIGTAVLLPMLRNPVILAHEGYVFGVAITNIRIVNLDDQTVTIR